ncbi:type II toxin-antitoxin system VapC family toxin [Natronosporangium hydrolyticum]|uniref:Ribonuclease VapC n=1 Tax=Natronosporangium hydrolyticum TaxID=2811111 RepID=A0A895YG45_9ACTN|nr:type II toxin-antitoxin system VapC family toxin [Natronosporangium hydrolyticum]QSB16844.1 type II toxin-antitoxin system VapC family toxin [Natronosporangium hydrolyticum]
MIYLDSAAAVKLIHAEAHSAALRRYLDERPELDWVSSALLEVETFRALARATPPAEMPIVINDFHTLLDFVDRIEIDAGIRIFAQTVNPPTVRSLDAIHLATGLRLHDQARLTVFVTYDKRLADAAAAAGLTVEMPTD